MLIDDIFTVHTRYTLGVYKNDSSQSWYTLTGAKERMEHSFLGMRSLCIFIVSHAVPARFCCSLYLFGLWMLDDAIRWNRYDSDNLFAKHCNPNLIVSRARCLFAYTNARPLAKKRRNENGIRVVHWRHVVSVMYHAEKARYSQFIFRFSHATINRSRS